MPFLDWTLYANSVRAWLLALLAAGVAFALLGLARTVAIAQLERLAGRTRTSLDDILLDVAHATKGWFLALLSLWIGGLFVVLPSSVRGGVGDAAALVVLLQLAIWGVAAIRSYVRAYTFERRDHDPASVTTVRALGFIGNLVVWAVVVLTGLDTLGIDVTALVAGLGIGGIAIALAVQNILGDLFASLSIVLDKPFVYGDFVVVGEMAGTVEHVGLKTTRVRSLSGEQLVFSNSDLLQSRIRNYKRMQERRILFSFGVVYQTPQEELERIPGLVREVVESLPDTRFDRAHFKAFGASSLDFEVVYFVLSAEYNLYMDRQQAINLGLFRRFAEAGIDFAYPTQTLYLEGVGAER